MKTFSWGADWLSVIPNLPWPNSCYKWISAAFSFPDKNKKVNNTNVYPQRRKAVSLSSDCCLLELWITADIFMSSAHQASQSTESTSRLILINKTTVCTLKCHFKTPLVAFQDLKHTFRSLCCPWHICTCLSLHSSSLLSSISPSPRC